MKYRQKFIFPVTVLHQVLGTARRVLIMAKDMSLTGNISFFINLSTQRVHIVQHILTSSRCASFITIGRETNEISPKVFFPVI